MIEIMFRERFTMRSDRKKEAQNQKKAGIYRIISIIYAILAIIFTVTMLWLNILPEKILYPALAVLVIISLFIVPVMYSPRGKKGRKKGAAVFAVILIIIFGMGTYYAGSTLGFFNSITSVLAEKEDFYLVVKADSSYEEADDVAGMTIATAAAADKTYTEARNKLKEEIKIEYSYVENASDMITGLLNGEYPAAFISAASYETITEESDAAKEGTKVIYTISIAKENSRKAKNVNVTSEPFNVLVSGLDTTGDINTVSRSDVNMIVTVNPKTHKILLTSIPRDSYVELASKGAKDKLTHSGLYGIEETVSTVENFMGIEINYYVKVNYSTITKLVDAIGGIDIDSPYGFTTHGMADQYTFVQGHNHLDGSMALAYSRERKSWPEGDLRRNENQQIIIEAILKKASSSSTILTDYTSILKSIEGNLATDMSSSSIKKLIKMQLKDMPAWTIEKQAIKGDSSSQMCYSLGTYASVVFCSETAVAEAADKITEVKGETGE